MSSIVKMQLKDGSPLYIEAESPSVITDAPASSQVRASVEIHESAYSDVSVTGDTVQAATTIFESALASVKPAIAALLNVLEDAEPDSFVLEFGLQVSVGTFVFIKAGGDANFKITMTWNKKP